jgi:predicted GIY-YIG superfamily endonuclease
MPSIAPSEGGRLDIADLAWKSSMFYTCILESEKNPGERYIGHTSDLEARLAAHNPGRSAHTAKFLPWKLNLYIAFETLEQAQHFERYLKSGSGHAFAKRHFWNAP